MFTTAEVHDSQICFDFIYTVMYGDKGYFGANFPGYKGFMLRKSNDPRINAFRQKRNYKISVKRAPVERPFAVFEEHGQDFTKLTTVDRDKVKMLFASIYYNIQQLITLKNPKIRTKEETEIYSEDDYEKISALFYCHENYLNGEMYYNGHLHPKYLEKIHERRIKTMKGRREKIKGILLKQSERRKSMKVNNRKKLVKTKKKKMKPKNKKLGYTF
jgi:hypothetical protein